MKNVQLPDDVYDRAAQLAERDHVSVDKLVAALVQEHAREWELLRSRAERGSLQKLNVVLSKVSNSPTEPLDHLS
jgi:predicted DNA-binding ribbon-helix-helix protein